MKTVFSLLVLVLCSITSFAQDWRCITPAKRMFYDLGNRFTYLGLDSSSISSQIEEYFFCTVPFDFNYEPNCMHLNAPGEFGSGYKHTLSGWDTFYNIHNNPIIFNTKAQLNDAWNFYSDTSGITFQASLINIGTQTINSNVDSIKTIQLQAYQNGNPITHVCNVNLILSKQNGLLTTSQWNRFPSTISFINAPLTFMDSSTYIYKPQLSELDRFQPGNEWILSETYIDSSSFSPTTYTVNAITFDSIISSTQLNANTIAYTSNRRKSVSAGPSSPFNNSFVGIVNDTFHSATVNNYRIVDSIPECEKVPITSTFAYFYPNDQQVVNYYSFGCQNRILVNSTLTQEFKACFKIDSCWACSTPFGYLPISTKTQLEGIGLTHKEVSLGNFSMDTISDLSYYNINGCTAGTKFNVILPSDYFTLEAIQKSDNSVVLSWQTINENHVKDFSIERSFKNEGFKQIGSSNSLGNNPDQNNYSFVDKLSEHGEYLYRIRMNDVDGKIKYSNSVSINFSNTKSTKVFPTSFKSEIRLQQLKPDSKYSVVLQSLVGTILRKQTIPENQTYFNLRDLNSLPCGLYLLQLINESDFSTETFKLIKE